MDVLRSLKNKGIISVMAMIDNDVVLPERYNWINDEDVDRIAFYVSSKIKLQKVVNT